MITNTRSDKRINGKDVSLILATGSEGMVRAAYASGTDNHGGPGNGPAFIERRRYQKKGDDIITVNIRQMGLFLHGVNPLSLNVAFNEVHRELLAQGLTL